jgi:hypothetical protein
VLEHLAAKRDALARVSLEAQEIAHCKLVHDCLPLQAVRHSQ